MRFKIILSTLLILTTPQCFGFNDISISLLYGDNYLVEPEKQTTATLEYVGGWEYGDIFSFVDFKSFPDVPSGDVDNTWYGEFSPRVKLYQFSDDSLVSKFYLAATLERGRFDVEANLFGVGFDINASSFRYLKANFYQRNDPDIPGKGYQMTGTWGIDFTIGSVPILFDGYFDWVFNSDEQANNMHFNPQIKIDMKNLVGGNHEWYLGIEYDYWKNKFGIEDSSFFETNQNTFSLLAKWHF